MEFNTSVSSVKAVISPVPSIICEQLLKLGVCGLGRGGMGGWGVWIGVNKLLLVTKDDWTFTK